MFSVIFEVRPRAERWDAYLGIARMLRPELEGIDGFVDNIRYRSLTREGRILSLSGWRDEKAVVRWRTRARHHAAQGQGRSEILGDYHLRVGEVVSDTRVPDGHTLAQQRLDATAVGLGTTVTLLDGRGPADGAGDADRLAARLGLRPDAPGLVAWDVFDAVLTPGDAILLMTWRDATTADAFASTPPPPRVERTRQVRVVRDYGMFDRREAPQYFPDAPGGPTLGG